MIELKNVCISFGSKPVIEGMCHGFEDGSTTAIMGPSGSGKTTLLRAILGLTPLSVGEITGVPTHIGVVFQEDRLIEGWNARDNVRLVCGSDITDAQIDAHLAEVGITDESDKRVKSFSGGMRRRVALVRALITMPELVMLDEPFKGLDPQARERAAAYVKKMCDKAMLILVTHDEAERTLIGAVDQLVIKV